MIEKVTICKLNIVTEMVPVIYGKWTKDISV
jgi:hypothetical protein